VDSLRFTKTQISIFGGVKGNIVKKLNYQISARYSLTKDMAFFFLDTASLLKNQFDVVYSNVNLLNVCANLNWQVVQKLYLNLEANYWGYFNLQNIEKPWYKPNWEVAFSGKYYLKEKFIFDANMKLGFSTYAYMPYLDADKQVVYKISKMKPVINFGIGFEYMITKRLSFFVAVNNIGFQHFAKYYDFKNMGFNAIIGIKYSFGNESLKRGKR
jgi:outer membrane receptor for ferrienterochelin and colicin